MELKMKHEFNDIVLSAPKRVVPGYSWVGHLPFAFWLVDELRPATIVELGYAYWKFIFFFLSGS